MHRSLQRTGLVIALIVSANWAGAQVAEEEPLAAELLAASKVFVKQTLIDPKIVSRLRSEIAKLERFEVVATEEEADLVAIVSAAVDYAPGTVGADDVDSPASDSGLSDAGERPMGTVRVLEDLYLRMFTPDGTEVWTDSVPIGSLIGNASRKLVKRLAQRLEDET